MTPSRQRRFDQHDQALIAAALAFLAGYALSVAMTGCAAAPTDRGRQVAAPLFRMLTEAEDTFLSYSKQHQQQLRHDDPAGSDDAIATFRLKCRTVISLFEEADKAAADLKQLLDAVDAGMRKPEDVSPAITALLGLLTRVRDALQLLGVPVPGGA